MTVICNLLCRFQIYRRIFFKFSSLGDNSVHKYYGIAVFGYFNFAVLAPKVKVAYNL